MHRVHNHTADYGEIGKAGELCKLSRVLYLRIFRRAAGVLVSTLRRGKAAIDEPIINMVAYQE